MTLPAQRLRPPAPTRPLWASDPCPPEVRALLQIILPVAAARFGVRAIEIVSKRRPDALIPPRAFVVWALRALEQPLSYKAIGRLLGGRDHTSCIYLHEKAQILRLRDAAFARACDAIARHLASEETIQ